MTEKEKIEYGKLSIRIPRTILDNFKMFAAEEGLSLNQAANQALQMWYIEKIKAENAQIAKNIEVTEVVKDTEDSN